MCFLIMVEAHPLFCFYQCKQWGKGERCCYFKCSKDAAHYYLQICSEEATHYYLQMCSEDAAHY